MISRAMFIKSKENHIAVAKMKIEVLPTSKVMNYKEPRRTTPKIPFNQTKVGKLYTTQSKQISSYNRTFKNLPDQDGKIVMPHTKMDASESIRDCVSTCIKTTRIKRYRNITRLSLRRWRWNCCRNLVINHEEERNSPNNEELEIGNRNAE